MRNILLIATFIGCVFSSFSQEKLSTEEKLYGLSTLWQEVNYNFAFFDQVPELDWDQAYKEAINEVLKTTSDLDYYCVLQRLAAKLQDGHTQVYFPAYLENKFSNLPIQVLSENDQYYIIDAAKQIRRKIQAGSKIITINQQPVQEYVNQHIKPFLASSTLQGYNYQIENYFFYGLRNESIQVQVLTPEGKEETVELKRNMSNYDIEWIREKAEFPDFIFTKNKNYSVVTLNSFEHTSVVTQFEEKINEINKSGGLIIDIRENIGGQSVVGLNIAKYLVANNQLVDVRWKSKQHIASHKAWGNSGLQLVGYEAVKEYKKFGDLNAWVEIEPDTLYLEENRKRVSVPVIILISEKTASSAENFLVFLDNQTNITTIGSPTFGSTGQPIYFQLPGDGYARVCAKRNYYPDGREFVGYGIKPDVLIKNTLRTTLQNEDTVMEKAVELLHK